MRCNFSLQIPGQKIIYTMLVLEHLTLHSQMKNNPRNLDLNAIHQIIII